MASVYPDDIVSFSERGVVNWNHAGRQNLLQDEIEAIQVELGILPKGDYASVGARLTVAQRSGPSTFVAARDASDRSKAGADYVCDGTADDVQIQAAIDALPS